MLKRFICILLVWLMIHQNIVPVAATGSVNIDEPESNEFIQISVNSPTIVGLREDGTVSILYNKDDLHWFYEHWYTDPQNGIQDYKNLLESYTLLEQANNIIQVESLGLGGSIATVNKIGQVTIYGPSVSVEEHLIGTAFLASKSSQASIIKDKSVATSQLHHYVGIRSWRGIKDLAVGSNFIAGLTTHGTVKYDIDSSAKDRSSNPSNIDQLAMQLEIVKEWTDIIQISAIQDHLIGLKSDGTVVSAGIENYGELQVFGDEWSDIVQIDTGGFFTAGLKSDGTVIVTPDNEYRTFTQNDINNIQDAIWLTVDDYCLFIAHADGTVETIGHSKERVLDNNFLYLGFNQQDFEDAGWKLKVYDEEKTEYNLIVDSVSKQEITQGEKVSFEILGKPNAWVYIYFDGEKTNNGFSLNSEGYAKYEQDIYSKGTHTIQFSILNNKSQESFTTPINILVSDKRTEDRIFQSQSNLQDITPHNNIIEPSNQTHHPNNYTISIGYIDDDNLKQELELDKSETTILTVANHLPIQFCVRDASGKEADDSLKWEFSYQTKNSVIPWITDTKTRYLSAKCTLDDYSAYGTEGITRWNCKLYKEKGLWKKETVDEFTIVLNRKLASQQRFQMYLSGIEDYTNLSGPGLSGGYSTQLINWNNVCPKVSFSVIDIKTKKVIDYSNISPNISQPHSYVTSEDNFTFYLTLDDEPQKYNLQKLEDKNCLSTICAIALKDDFKMTWTFNQGFGGKYRNIRTINLWRDDYIIDTYCVKVCVYDGSIRPLNYMFDELGEAITESLYAILCDVTIGSYIAVDSIIYQVVEGPDIGYTLETIGLVSETHSKITESIVKHIYLEDLLGYDENTSNTIFGWCDTVGSLINPIDTSLHIVDGIYDTIEWGSEKYYEESTIRKTEGFTTIIRFLGS